jgi:two-component system, chemotaxis family, chemotaxis protein CheY
MDNLPRILIVDDFADSAEMIRQVLRPLANCVTANSGVEALREYRDAREAGAPFDLVILDLAMPDLSGFDVSEAIRSTGDQATKIVYLTAYNDPENASLAAMDGVLAIWQKPFSPSQLCADVMKILGSS